VMPEVMDYIDNMIDHEFHEVPEYGFTMKDFQARMKEKGMKVADESTIRRKLMRKVEAGELKKVKLGYCKVYYVPSELAKNTEIDVEAVMEHGN